MSSRITSWAAVVCAVAVLAAPLAAAAQESVGERPEVPTLTRTGLRDQVRAAAAEIAKESASRAGFSERNTAARKASPQAESDSSLYMLIGGLGIAGVGAIIAATSGESATLTYDDPYFGQTSTLTASTRSTGQLVAGIAMMGGGAVLAIFGITER